MLCQLLFRSNICCEKPPTLFYPIILLSEKMANYTMELEYFVYLLAQIKMRPNFGSKRTPLLCCFPHYQ